MSNRKPTCYQVPTPRAWYYYEVAVEAETGKKVRGRGEKADNNYASYTRFLSLSEYILATRVVYNPPVFPCSR